MQLTVRIYECHYVKTVFIGKMLFDRFVNKDGGPTSCLHQFFYGSHCQLFWFDNNKADLGIFPPCLPQIALKTLDTGVIGSYIRCSSIIRPNLGEICCGKTIYQAQSGFVYIMFRQRSLADMFWWGTKTTRPADHISQK